MKYLSLFIFLFSTSALATSLATFAGGCFWCMEPPFDKLTGVIRTTSGFSGGDKKNPSYKEVSSGKTRHREAVQVEFDPQKVSYETLLKAYWMSFDPTDNEGQFNDRGFQYTPAIFYHDENQKKLAEQSLLNLEKSHRFSKKIVTPILQYKNFYPAEDYHQDYYQKNPLRYKYYRYLSGRDGFLEKHWKKTKEKK